MKLHLLGKPQLTVDGHESPIEPRSAFECLAQIVCAGHGGVTRAVLASRLWDHLDPLRARAQLRISLHHLKASIKLFGIEDYFDLGGQVLRVLKPVSLDIDELHEVTVKGIEQLLLPFADGWPPSHWYTQSDEVGEIFADTFGRSSGGLQNGSGQSLLPLVRKATQFYPTCTRLNALLVQLLVDKAADSEANEVVIAFEDNWVERFGSSDIPSIQAVRVSNELERRIISARRRWTVAVCLIVSALTMVIFYAARGTTNVRFDPPFALPVVEEVPKVPPFRIWKLSFGPGIVPEVRRLSNSDFGLFCRRTTHVSSPFVWRNHRSFEKTDAQTEVLVDELGNWKLFGSISNPSSLRATDGVQSMTLRGNPMYPHVIAESLLGENCVLFERCCDHASLDHRRTCVWMSGIEHPIDTAYSKVQVSVATAKHGNTIFGKCTSGASDRWRYHTFRYDIGMDRSEKLDCSPVIAVSSNGDLATLPEVTDEVLGDLNTHWDGTIQIISTDHSAHLIKINGRSEFIGVIPLGDFLIVQTSNHPNSPGLVAVDYLGQRISGLDALLAKARSVIPSEDGIRGGYGSFCLLEVPDKGSVTKIDYFLIEPDTP